MPSLNLKRTILVVISLAIGALVTWGIVYLNIPIGPADAPFIAIGFGTNFRHFAYSNVAFLFISVACIVGIWLDYFMDTKILKS